MLNLTGLFQEWSEADRVALLSEQRLLHASIQAFGGELEAPAEKDLAEADRLRKKAEELLALAMTEMRRKVEARRLLA